MVCKDSNSYDGIVPLLIGATGHRDLRDQDIPLLEGKVRDLLSEINSTYPSTPIIILSSLAEGADQLIAKVALDLGANLAVPLPFSKEDYEQDFESPESLKEFRMLLNRADIYYELPLLEGNTNENIKVKGIHRNLQYASAGNYIAHHCQVLIGLWDGETSGEVIGGTAQIISCRLKGSTGFCASRQSLLDPIESGPVFYILTPRASNQNVNGEPFSVNRCFPDSMTENGNAEIIHQKVLKNIDNYNRDIRRLTSQLKGQIQKSSRLVIPEGSIEKLSPTQKTILKYYAAADTLSQYFQSKSIRVLNGLIILVVIAFFFFQLYLEIFSYKLLLAFYPFTLGVAFFWYFQSKRTSCQTKHLDYRALAEGFRVQLFWNLAGLKDDVAKFYLRKQKNELEWIRQSIQNVNISVCHELHLVTDDNMPIQKNNYDLILHHWVSDQLRYFSMAMGRDWLKLRRRERYSSILYWLGIASAVGMLVTYDFLQEFEVLRHIIVISIAMFLSMAAAIQGHIEKTALSEHFKQYYRMRDLFTTASKHLTSDRIGNNISETRRLVKDLGTEALMENADWVLVHRSRPISVPKG